MRKQSIIKLKCAQTFVFKSRCKFCKSGPKYIFFLLNRFLDEKNIVAILKYYSDNFQLPHVINDNHYIESSIKNRAFRPSYMFDFNTTYFRKITPPNSKYEANKDKFTSILECECAATTWSFVDSRRKHIRNRKNIRTAPKLDVKSLYKIMI